MKKISVIIPCYNVAGYLDRCMISIAAQTIRMKNLEIICIDDASTDDTWLCLQKWEKLFPDNILLIRRDVNGKPGMARNIGLQYASADWIAYVDADDWLEPDHLEKLYAPVEKNDCDVVVCGAILDRSNDLSYFSEVERTAGKEEFFDTEKKEIKKLMMRYRILGETVWAKLVRKRLLMDHRIYFPENLFYEDVYWLPYLYMYAAGIYIIEEKLYHHFHNITSVVYSKNAEHHVDSLTIQLMKWEDYNKQGFWDIYRDELEYDLLHDAMGITNMIVARYDKPPFHFFEAERAFMKKCVPNFRKNPYVVDFNRFSIFLLDLLYSEIDEKGFYQVSQKLKASYDSIKI